MTLRLRISSLEDVPAALRPLYRPIEGGSGFALDCEADNEAASIRTKFDKLSADHARAQERLQSFAKPDGSLLTVDELKALQAAAAKASEADPAAIESKLAAMVAQAKGPLEAELTAGKKKLDAYRQRLLDAEGAAIVARALDAMNPIAKWRPLLTKELRRRIQVVEAEDGTIGHEVVGDDGKPIAGAKLEDMARGSLRREFGEMLQGDNKKGADLFDNSKDTIPARDVVISQNATQAQFEVAYKTATARGGQVIFA